MTGSRIRTAVVCVALLAGVATSVRADEGPADAPPPAAEATYDATQPGADDPRVKAGFDAYRAGDFKKARDIWLPLANAGNAEAQFRMGNMYSFGHGVEKSDTSASYWWERATDENHLRAMFNLAHHLIRGPEELRNPEKGVKFLSRAARCGHVRSQLFYGVAFAVGVGVERNDVSAFKWMYIARQNGSEGADYSIDRLSKLSDDESRLTGEKKMREWFNDHPRKCHKN